MIHSAFANLVDNAAKYTPPEGSVQMRWWTDEQGGHFSVTDTGIGIAPRSHPAADRALLPGGYRPQPRDRRLRVWDWRSSSTCCSGMARSSRSRARKAAAAASPVTFRASGSKRAALSGRGHCDAGSRAKPAAPCVIFWSTDRIARGCTMEAADLTHHTSKRFNEDLERVRSKVLAMGGFVEEQLGRALTALVEGDSSLGRAVARTTTRSTAWRCRSTRSAAASSPPAHRRPAICA